MCSVKAGEDCFCPIINIVVDIDIDIDIKHQVWIRMNMKQC